MSYHNRRIWITGIRGFLGHHLSREFFGRGAWIGGNDTGIGGNNALTHMHSFVSKDCTDLEQMEELFSGHEPDTVLHTACYPHEGLSVFSPSVITKSVFQGTVATATAAIKANVKLFINMSSMSRYGSNQTPFTEDMTPAPNDPYAVAKVAAEKALNILGDTHGMKVVHAVPHNIIGAFQRYNDPFRNVASIMIHRALAGKSIIVYGDGSQVRCFSPVVDVLPTLVALTNQSHPIPHGEVFNVGPDQGGLTILELAATIRELVASTTGGPPVAIEHMPARPREVHHAVCSSDKIRNWFGFAPKQSLRDCLIEMIQWMSPLADGHFDYHLPVEIMNEKTPQTWAKRLI